MDAGRDGLQVADAEQDFYRDASSMSLVAKSAWVKAVPVTSR